MKNITIAGGLTRDAELRSTQSGDKVLSFSVGVSDGRDKPSTYFACSMFGKRGEGLAPYLTKGTKVTVAGDLSTREHEGKTYLQVRVDQLTLQGGKSESGQRDSGQSQGSGYGGGGSAMSGGRSNMDDGDSIPFSPQFL